MPDELLEKALSKASEVIEKVRKSDQAELAYNKLVLAVVIMSQSMNKDLEADIKKAKLLSPLATSQKDALLVSQYDILRDE